MTKHNKTEKVKVINIEGMTKRYDYPLTYFTKIIKDFFLYFESKTVSFYLASLYIFNVVVVLMYSLTVLVRTKAHKVFMCSLMMDIRNKGIMISLNPIL